nr:immunoglobulin heavy chain junction region [Macaca mulatta]MOV49398.1 immunoglobulin heavy chain junction region [Macaca mulatta]MOV49438.1 immunoglobulin heavy chain junction region [Macaca mulatta]MOV49451.1 immunoglobulin heavy chain junction region [Macaca mulatta]MOV49697.1 immunoglobulin heavy chain junction region [Macaca mulatta]
CTREGYSSGWSHRTIYYYGLDSW